jgi:ketosteroid isomerase-like protein
VKKSNIVMVSIAALAALVCRWAPAARADDRQEISDLEHKVAIAPNADEAMKYFDLGDDVVVFDMMGPPRVFTGRKAIHDHWAGFPEVKDVKADFLELKVISDGKLAVALSEQHYTAKNADGKPLDMTFRQTDLWRKTNGQWKLVHMHISFPVDLKTGKADMASKM